MNVLYVEDQVALARIVASQFLSAAGADRMCRKRDLHHLAAILSAAEA